MTTPTIHSPLHTGIVRAAVCAQTDDKLIYIYQYGSLTAHHLGAHLVSAGYMVHLRSGGDLWHSARLDARERGYRLVNCDDIKPKDTVWAMVTPDSTPTECEVVRWYRTLVALNSKRTKLNYETTCDRVFRTREECKRYGSCYDPQEAFTDYEEGYVVCLSDNNHRPVAAIGNRPDYDTALTLLRLVQHALNHAVGIWRVDVGLGSLLEWRV